MWDRMLDAVSARFVGSDVGSPAIAGSRTRLGTERCSRSALYLVLLSVDWRHRSVQVQAAARGST